MHNFKKLDIWNRSVEFVTDIYIGLSIPFPRLNVLDWFHRCKELQYLYRLILQKAPQNQVVKILLDSLKFHLDLPMN